MIASQFQYEIKDQGDGSPQLRAQAVLSESPGSVQSSSQHAQDGSQLSLTPVPVELMLSSDLQGYQTWDKATEWALRQFSRLYFRMSMFSTLFTFSKCKASVVHLRPFPPCPLENPDSSHELLSWRSSMVFKPSSLTCSSVEQIFELAPHQTLHWY